MKKKVNSETTEKEGGSATLTRVRDNQRRSRARRKEYIEQLEQRLRSFESQGVVASQEIQQAGRKVAKENSLLRSLLLLRGVTQDEIEDFLKSHAEYTPRVVLGSASARSRPITPQHWLPIDLGVSERPCERKASTLPRGEDFDESRVLSQYRSVEVHADNNAYGLTTFQPSTTIPANIPGNAPTLQRLNEIHQEQGHFISCESAAENSPTLQRFNESQQEQGNFTSCESAAEDPPTLQRFNESHQEQGNFTSCESAARIIASLRGHNDTHDLRSELGCGAEASCMVKNLSLFEMLDR